MRIDTLITDARIASMVPGETPYGVIEDGAIAISGGAIAWVGERRDAPTGRSDRRRQPQIQDQDQPG